MKKAWLFILLPLLLGACLKDDLDTDTLTTNPIDRDYDGTPLLELIGDSTWTAIPPGGTQTDTLHSQTVRVRTDLLPPLTTWTWEVTDLTTSAVLQAEAGDQITVVHQGASNGGTYCWRYALVIQFTAGKPYTFCTTAEL